MFKVSYGQEILTEVTPWLPVDRLPNRADATAVANGILGQAIALWWPGRLALWYVDACRRYTCMSGLQNWHIQLIKLCKLFIYFGQWNQVLHFAKLLPLQ